MSLVYQIFANDGAGGQVDYTTVVATVSSLSQAMSALALGSDTTFAVRAHNTVTGFTDKNVDAQARIILDGSGNDVTNRPLAPPHLRAMSQAGGSVAIEWLWPFNTRSKTPTGFHVYLGTSGTVNYGTVKATVPYIAGRPAYRAVITGLTDGTAYVAGVRAYNAIGEEPNTSSVSFTADATPPASVLSLISALVV